MTGWWTQVSERKRKITCQLINNQIKSYLTLMIHERAYREAGLRGKPNMQGVPNLC